MLACVSGNVAERVVAPVLFVDASSVLVDLDGVGARAPCGGQRGMKAADASEEVGVGEGLVHDSS